MLGVRRDFSLQKRTLAPVSLHSLKQPLFSFQAFCILTKLNSLWDHDLRGLIGSPDALLNSVPTNQFLYFL